MPSQHLDRGDLQPRTCRRRNRAPRDRRRHAWLRGRPSRVVIVSTTCGQRVRIVESRASSAAHGARPPRVCNAHIRAARTRAPSRIASIHTGFREVDRRHCATTADSIGALRTPPACIEDHRTHADDATTRDRCDLDRSRPCAAPVLRARRCIRVASPRRAAAAPRERRHRAPDVSKSFFRDRARDDLFGPRSDRFFRVADRTRRPPTDRAHDDLEVRRRVGAYRSRNTDARDGRCARHA